MEVHAHTHTPRKKWMHYFWEFLMLFLAVFAGFLAENQREHMVEHQREIKYASSLYEDLKKDTIDFKEDTPFWESIINNIDTLREEIEKPAEKRNALRLYRNAAKMRRYDNFLYHDRTIEQLKNGGNFRLLRKTIIADSLIDYDASIKSVLRDREMQSNTIYQTINFLQDKFLNSKYVSISRTDTISLDAYFITNPVVFKIPATKEAELFEYYNHLQYYKTLTRYRRNTTIHLLRKATNLIALLEKEYHLSESTHLDK